MYTCRSCPKDSAGIVYIKYFTQGFKIGRSCNKNSKKRIKDKDKNLGNPIEVQYVETRFHNCLEDKFKIKLHDKDFEKTGKGEEYFIYKCNTRYVKDNISRTNEIIFKILKTLRDKVDEETINIHHIGEQYPSEIDLRKRIDMRTNESKILVSKIDAKNELQDVVIKRKIVMYANAIH